MILVSALLSLAAWLYLVFLHGRFWNVRPLGTMLRAPATAPARIAAVVPARNEADVIGRAVASLLRQSYGGQLHVFVVDDNSNDGTAEAACKAASEAGAGDRVTIISGNPLPAGWTGKMWAVHQGVQEALALHPDFLLLTDADVQHAPHNAASLIAIAGDGGYDLVSFMVKLHCRSFAEKLLIPAFVFFFFMLYPPQWIRDPKRKTAGAAGGCMLIRPAALEKAGGVDRIRHEIIDDCALARGVKKAGGRVWLGVTDETRSIRPYESFGEIERMIARTAFNQLQHSTWLLLGATLGMLLVYVLPLALLLSRSLVLASIGAAAYLLMTVAYLPMIRHYRLSVPWAFALPASALFYTGATLHSALKYWTGKGGEWKGRAQDRVRR